MTLNWFDDAADRAEAWDVCLGDVRTYFASAGGVPSYSGSHFESFGENPWNRIVVDDLVAVSMLSVHVPAHAALCILDRSAGEILELLARVPTDMDLHEPDALAHIDTGSAADKLWRLLRRTDRDAGLFGTGPVTTSKLLARKRPRLLPVYDSIVNNELSSSLGTYWVDLHRFLCQSQRVETLCALRSAAEVPHISLIRLLDVVLWMHGKRSRNDWQVEGTEETDGLT